MTGARPITPVANYQCQVGENPLWNERDGRVYWEDIDTGRLFWARHDTLEHRCFYTGDVVGGFTLQADGSLLLFEADRISVLDPESGVRRVLRSGIDPDMKRFNDVIADPEGRVFAGTIGQSVNSGGLYRVDRDGSIRCLFKDTGCANGMGFSTDLSRFYWTCSTKRCIYAFDYDRGSGELENRRVLYQAHPSEGLPDGLAVDERDDLWSARWDGSSVLRISPDGRMLERIEFPVKRVSSVAFGGPERDTLYVTTAGAGWDGPGDDGTLYRMPAGVRGRPEFRSRIGI
jgi:sugar lactone lactonase YvrE